MGLDKLEDDRFITEENAFGNLTIRTLYNMVDFSEYYKVIMGKEMTDLDRYMFQMYLNMYGEKVIG